jgi:hypothetical protein
MAWRGPQGREVGRRRFAPKAPPQQVQKIRGGTRVRLCCSCLLKVVCGDKSRRLRLERTRALYQGGLEVAG